jgi:hypothetical protein
MSRSLYLYSQKVQVSGVFLEFDEFILKNLRAGDSNRAEVLASLKTD